MDKAQKSLPCAWSRARRQQTSLRCSLPSFHSAALNSTDQLYGDAITGRRQLCVTSGFLYFGGGWPRGAPQSPHVPRIPLMLYDLSAPLSLTSPSRAKENRGAWGANMTFRECLSEDGVHGVHWGDTFEVQQDVINSKGVINN
jgi:hypothetical protein